MDLNLDIEELLLDKRIMHIPMSNTRSSDDNWSLNLDGSIIRCIVLSLFPFSFRISIGGFKNVSRNIFTE